jgi:hypothetical protein
MVIIQLLRPSRQDDKASIHWANLRQISLTYQVLKVFNKNRWEKAKSNSLISYKWTVL